ncbi:MAG: hypothetical protein ACK550_14230, partial [Synechococcaceae cyanobacterium]
AVVAEWDPADPSRRLRKLSEEKSRRALQDLEASLQQRLEAPEGITAGLKGHLSADVAQLREALDLLVEQRREDAAGKLGKRAEEEAARFCKVLEEQRQRIRSSRSRVKENPDQLLLALGDIADAEELKAVRRQVSDNWRYWEQRLASIDTDLEREPERIRRTFALQTHRVEPAGAIYLWPQVQ